MPNGTVDLEEPVLQVADQVSQLVGCQVDTAVPLHVQAVDGRGRGRRVRGRVRGVTDEPVRETADGGWRAGAALFGAGVFGAVMRKITPLWRVLGGRVALPPGTGGHGIAPYAPDRTVRPLFGSSGGRSVTDHLRPVARRAAPNPHLGVSR